MMSRDEIGAQESTKNDLWLRRFVSAVVSLITFIGASENRTHSSL